MGSVTRTLAPRKGRSPEMEERVLKAVVELLADGTRYTELPVQRIIDTAGIARSTFYQYFPDKSKLLLRLADKATAGIFAAAEEWWLSDHSGGAEQLTAAMASMIADFRRHRTVLRAIGEVAGYDSDVSTYWLGRMRPFIRFAEGRLRQLQSDGRVSTDLDPPTVAHVITWASERSISHLFGTGDSTDDERLARALGRTIWLAIYGDAPDIPGTGSRPRAASMTPRA